jgi:hypothetical protein
VGLIFEEIDKAKNLGWKYTLSASIIEIYMENVRDLLDTDNKTEDPSSIDVHNIYEIRGLLDLARNNRKVA